MMEVQSQSLDRISTLPQDTIEKILTLLPIQDALRTSVLSKKWRHCWKGMPKLVFDDKYLNSSSSSKEINKYKFVTSIFHVLLLHNGPILEFSISINIDTEIVDQIDQIILHLSKSKNIKKFILFCLNSGFGIRLKQFAKGSMQKLPTLLVHLRILFLDVCFLKQDELSYALGVINSAPNLEKIKIESCWNHKLCGQQTCKDLLDLQDYYLGMKLDHLEELEINSFHNYAPEMEFVKLVMAKSPMLKKARIKLNSDVSVDKENKILRDLLRLTFPRASPAVDIIVER
ncbi:unnamed protein product [Lactuca virosa]|uniref:F-box domain-containing protein n=1 Tax=Lactuca virosa TaxID=75947 RepID=A0AAU9LTD0_9ASTR|nr:unnamed protein product [Lactuca virosa]